MRTIEAELMLLLQRLSILCVLDGTWINCIQLPSSILIRQCLKNSTILFTHISIHISIPPQDLLIILFYLLVDTAAFRKSLSMTFLLFLLVILSFGKTYTFLVLMLSKSQFKIPTITETCKEVLVSRFSKKQNKKTKQFRCVVTDFPQSLILDCVVLLPCTWVVDVSSVCLSVILNHLGTPDEYKPLATFRHVYVVLLAKTCWSTCTIPPPGIKLNIKVTYDREACE